MRRSGVGRDAAPAAVARTHGLGRSGVTVRAHYGALPLDGWTGQVEGGRKPAGSVALVAASLARKYGPSNRKAAVARRKAMRASKPPSHGGFETRSATTRAFRRAASPHVRGRKLRTPRTLRRRENANRCLNLWIGNYLRRRSLPPARQPARLRTGSTAVRPWSA